MASAKWEPLEGLAAFGREMNQLLEDFLGGKPPGSSNVGPLEPVIEVADTEDAVIVKAHVPGVSKDRLQIVVTNTDLTLKGELQPDQEQPLRRYYRQEIRYGTFSRLIPLPVAVQSGQATAQLKDGVLRVIIPKIGQGQAQQVPIP
jgi:HSP20 family protein